MPLPTNKKRQLNMNILRSKSHADLVAYIKLGIDDTDTAGIAYQIPPSFYVYYFALEAAIIEAHTTVTEGKGKNILLPYVITA